MRRYLLALLAAMLAFGPAAPASAQSVTRQGSIKRPERESTKRDLYSINYDDCVDNDLIQVPIQLQYMNLTLAWWGGTGNCSDDTQRALSNSTACWEIDSDDPAGYTEIEVSVKELMAGLGSDDLCETAGSGTVHLFIMLLDGQNQKASLQETFSYDFSGPDPPTNVKLGIGDERLFPEWDGSTGSDLTGYRIYCEPIADADDCTAPNLHPGARPPENLNCGSSRSDTADSGQATGLSNGQRYAIGVAAVDDDENVGTLSDLVCGTPEPVTGYFEAYRDAGGQAGGGFCAFGRRGPTGWLWVFAAASLGLWRRRGARPRGIA